jgi:hypothetical protein
MEIVDKPHGLVGLRMTVALGPVMGTIVETSTIFYVDETRYMFVYGLRGDEGPSSMRVVWLEPTATGTTLFRSYDMIGGWPAHCSRGHIVAKCLEGFNEQHLALRDRVYALQMRRAETAGRPSANPPVPPVVEPLGVCLVTGGCGFLGEHLVRMLGALSNVSHVHIVDLQPPRRELPAGVTFHQGSVTDAAFVAALFASVRPATVFHLAALIDLRPGTAARKANERVNRDATVRLLALAQQHGVRRLVYTSTIEAGYHSNTCVDVDETTHPYQAHPSNHYQRTKIEAERAVLLAHRSGSLATVVCRPAHIIGHPEWDNLAEYLKDVPVCFGTGFKLMGNSTHRALMSMGMNLFFWCARVVMSLKAFSFVACGSLLNVRLLVLLCFCPFQFQFGWRIVRWVTLWQLVWPHGQSWAAVPTTFLISTRTLCTFTTRSPAHRPLAYACRIGSFFLWSTCVCCCISLSGPSRPDASRCWAP